MDTFTKFLEEVNDLGWELRGQEDNSVGLYNTSTGEGREIISQNDIKKLSKEEYGLLFSKLITTQGEGFQFIK